jgi:hypothetical protein
MPNLHIVQAGIENGDAIWLERASRLKRDAKRWVVPKNATIGDDVVVFLQGHGFIATARIKSSPVQRADWPNRYRAGLTRIRLIQPAISLGEVQRLVPALAWTRYPRSITTPTPEIADQIRVLVRQRSKSWLPDVDVEALDKLNIAELRHIALQASLPTAPQRLQSRLVRLRSRAIHLYVLRRANGRCEGCAKPAPFLRSDGSAYLEPHHVKRVADDGPDHPRNVIALCPTCHRRAHHAVDSVDFNRRLERRVRLIEVRSDPLRHSGNA